MSEELIPPPSHASFVDKLRLLAASLVAIVLLYGVGGHVVRDPIHGLAVMLLLNGGQLTAIGPALLGLTVVAACVGTVIAGRRLPEGGLFAAGVGLAALALRGRSMQTVLGYCAQPNAESRRSLMVSLALDALLWGLMMVVAWLAAMMVRRWLWPPAAGSAPRDEETSDHRRVAQPDAPLQKDTRAGWLAMATTAAVGAVVIWLTVARTPVANVARGQVFACVTAGLLLGAMVGRHMSGCDEVRWYLLAVPVVALVGYLLGYLNADMSWATLEWQPYRSLAIVPPHALVRPLPIEYIALGVMGTLAGFWSVEKMHDAGGDTA
jgi:hypothetical protein